MSDPIIISSPGWQFKVRVDGNDLVVDDTTATWFGGDSDPLDNGETACGYPTKGHPLLLACSLPMVYNSRSLRGSPLPMMPYGLFANGKPRPGGTNVLVTYNGTTHTLPVIDLGPAKSAGDGSDLTVAAFKKFGVPLKKGVIKVSYRIPGGARYLKPAGKV